MAGEKRLGKVVYSSVRPLGTLVYSVVWISQTSGDTEI